MEANAYKNGLALIVRGTSFVVLSQHNIRLRYAIWFQYFVRGQLLEVQVATAQCQRRPQGMDVAPALCYLLFNRQRIRLFGIGLSGWSMATAISHLRICLAILSLLRVDWAPKGIGFSYRELRSAARRRKHFVCDSFSCILKSNRRSIVLMVAMQPSGLLRRISENCHHFSGKVACQLSVSPHNAVLAFEWHDPFQPFANRCNDWLQP